MSDPVPAEVLDKLIATADRAIEDIREITEEMDANNLSDVEFAFVKDLEERFREFSNDLDDMLMDAEQAAFVNEEPVVPSARS